MPELATDRRRLVRADFALDAPKLAKALIGRRLVRILADGTRLSGIIVETEAYLGAVDQAAHSYRGRRTPRTEPMFGPPGTAYVYFTYGMHHCMNVAAGQEGQPVAVLIRALEPEEGLDIMAAHRLAGRNGTATAAKLGKTVKAGGLQVSPEFLCSGPGKLCQALAIDRSFSGVDLPQHPGIFIEEGLGPVPPRRLANTPRIGVDGAGQWARARLRWFLRGSRHVSV